MKSARIYIGCALSIAVFFGALFFFTGGHKFYSLSTNGEIKPAQKGEFGLPRQDAEFLSNFTGPIIDRVPQDRDELRNYLKKSILNEFEGKKEILSGNYAFKSEREKLITYVLLRVNGSLPIYRVLDHVPDDLTSLLTGNKGNCSDAAIRLLMVLDVLGIAGRTITVWTPALTGHVVVDAYDPVERKAYLLDPSYNVFSRIENADEGYFDVLFSITVQERDVFLNNADNIKFWPFFMVGLQKPNEDAGGGPELDEMRENAHLSIRDKILVALTYELRFAFEDWKQHFPSRMPMTLDWYSYSRKKTMFSKAITALTVFGPQNQLAIKSLLEKASLRCDDFKKAELNCSEIEKLGYACNGCR